MATASRAVRKFTAQKNSVVVVRESMAVALLAALEIDIQMGAILIVRDDVPPDEIDQIVAAARKA